MTDAPHARLNATFAALADPTRRAILTMLLKSPELMSAFDLSSVRVIGSGGAPLSPWMVREYQQAHGIVVVNIFGSNEGMALISGSEDVPDPEHRAEK